MAKIRNATEPCCAAADLQTALHNERKYILVTKKAKPATARVESLPSPSESIVVRPRALVFVSHDSRDADIAEAFSTMLADVSAGTLKSFRSSDKKASSGIEFGTEWYASIMAQLDDATDVVALLTARSINRPWILYEAGVAKGKLEATVLGLALGVPLEQVSSGPFGQFQNCGDDEDSLTKLVLQLLARNPDAAPREEAVRRQVGIFIGSLRSINEKKPKETVEVIPDEQNAAKLFEEVKAMVRELPERLEGRSEANYRRFNRSFPRVMGERLMSELMSRLEASKIKLERASILLVALSYVRDSVPWMYESGMVVYRAIISGDSLVVEVARQQFSLIRELMMDRLNDRTFLGDKENHYVLIELFPAMINAATALNDPKRSPRLSRLNRNQDLNVER